CGLGGEVDLPAHGGGLLLGLCTDGGATRGDVGEDTVFGQQVQVAVRVGDLQDRGSGGPVQLGAAPCVQLGDRHRQHGGVEQGDQPTDRTGKAQPLGVPGHVLGRAQVRHGGRQERNQDLGHAPAHLGTLGRHVLVALFGDPIQRGDVDTLFTGEPFHGAGGVSLCVESGRDLGSLDGDGAVRFAVGDVGDVDDDATRGGRHGDAAV